MFVRGGWQNYPAEGLSSEQGQKDQVRDARRSHRSRPTQAEQVRDDVNLKPVRFTDR